LLTAFLTIFGVYVKHFLDEFSLEGELTRILLFLNDPLGTNPETLGNRKLYISDLSSYFMEELHL